MSEKCTIWVTGANGQLGREMRTVLTAEKTFRSLFTDVQELDITDAVAVEKYMAAENIDFIVNCAAYTQVEQAEENESLCRKINAEAVGNLAEAAIRHGAKIVQISTDYVFDGMGHKPYGETDIPAPASVYGRTKLEGERLLLSVAPDSAAVIRTSWLYSPYGNNFVKTMIRLGQERELLKVVSDQVGTPTYAADLAFAILVLLKTPVFVPGIYHFSNEGVCSWYDFTRSIHRLAGIDCKVLPIGSSEYPARVCRPFYSVLNKKKIKETYTIEIPHWEDSLARCIEILKKQEKQ